ncbi:hypothetical protein [Bradyrhizobium japonicum]|uniref:hypothetical protein n=1 Tax=Bradyrhizobium japonicum TaxID=375 RepID=UPI001E45AB58|nr:hypothetical protein [Bradyrhizobium japonicum]MCD9817620.1 hypothetical protein [Bradyrhizobium japonicum]MEB2672537.1 hypothetical protein [Bradyrhizobium japonicum]WRI91798.1 hypothetical protein R3F75_13060 [Bradyrhizobium japonicum]
MKMGRSRQPIRLRVKCAAALLALTDDKGEPLIPWEHAKEMTSDQIISLFQFDHYPIRAEAGGPALPWNLVPRLIRAHRRKTAKIDLPEIAHIRAVTKSEAEFRARLLAKDRGEPRPPIRWPKRSFRRREDRQ